MIYVEPFCTTQKGIHMALSSVPVTKGNFHDVHSSWCPANERGGCPQITCSGNPLRWDQPWVPSGTFHLPKEKWWHLYHKSKEDSGEASTGSSCHCCHEKPGWCQCHPPGILASSLCWSLLLPLERLLLLGASLLEPSLIRSRQPSRSLVLLVDITPGLTNSLYVNLSTITLCNSESPFLLCGHCHPLQWQGSSLSGSDVVEAGPGSSVQASMNTHERSCVILLIQRSWKDWKGRAGYAKKAVTVEDFQANELLQLLTLLLLNLR